MSSRREWKFFFVLLGIFLICVFLPVGHPRFDHAVLESLYLVQWYARKHVVLCLIPAFFIAGAIAIFVSQAGVMKYLGPQANKILAYGVASVSGTILAVCSCTVLPLFAGIYRMGAGLGPATAFLYSGPAINVLAIILTARVLGLELGIARAVGAILFSVIIGLGMHLIFRKEEMERIESRAETPQVEESRPLWKTASYFASMVAILVFANWGSPAEASGFWAAVYSAKWTLTGLFAVAFGLILLFWFGVSTVRIAAVAIPVVALAFLFPNHPLIGFVGGLVGLSIITGTAHGELRAWFDSTWEFAKQIFPLLFIGVVIAGLLLGRPGEEGLIPSGWVAAWVGGNSIRANLFSALVGAFMYFATLTEVPILQGLIGSGMGKGPALALLLAGPALSLPNMLVLQNIMGARKTIVYISLVVVMATITGLLYGAIF